MRNFILSFLFLCIPYLANAQEIQDEEFIEFADAKVKAICVQNWDTNHDGELSYSEAAAVTDIGEEFRYSEITSFDELQYFTRLTSIGGDAFRACKYLTSIVIPNSVTSISLAFHDCSGLTNIIVASDNPVYDSRDNCNAIIETSSNTLITGCMNTEIPNSVTSIGEEAFRGCKYLTSIMIPNSVTSIGWGAFMDCSSLTSIEIQNSVTSIEGEAFCGCSSLTSIEIPNSVTSIGWSAFEGCSGLTSIEIPNSVTFIHEHVFMYCEALTNIIVASDNPVYDSRDNCNAIIETSTNTLIAGCKNTLIPNSVTSIRHDAFYGSNLTSIEIPNSITKIGGYTFEDCVYLTSISIPNSITSIGQEAFHYCDVLTNFYCYAETVPSTDSSAFIDSNYENATLHVPACAIDDYRNTEPWSGFGNIVPLDPMEFELTVSDAGIATLYLDYSVAIPDVEGLGDVMYVSDVVGRSLVLTKVENNIPAHTGVIVYAQPGTYTFTSSTTHVDACANSRLSGVTEDTPTADIDGTVYTLSVGKNQGSIGFRKFTGETLAANKAFLALNKSGDVKFFDFKFDGELTGISTTEQDVDAESAVIYDLQGRRVTSPSKGTYIVNGQKRFINNR